MRIESSYEWDVLVILDACRNLVNENRKFNRELDKVEDDYFRISLMRIES